ncbi:MAG TPA: PAS domain S-box protein [Methylomirabilota bacterium]|nr:PAS domain S-box protein [Methylomirabilota bacterium]
MKTSVENKVVVGFATSVLALLGLGWLSYQTSINSTTAQDWVTHTYKVVATLEQGRAILTDAETAQRGYLLTGDEIFSKDTQNAQSRVAGWLVNLRQLTADNLEQQKRLDELHPLISQRLAMLNNRIQLRREKGFQAAVDAVATRQGTALSQKIQNAITAMRDAEDQLLLQRQQALRADTRFAEATILIATALAVIIGLVAVIFIHRDLKKRREAEEILRQSEERARLMIGSIKDYAVIMLDPGGRVMSWNEGARSIKGYTAEEIVGQHFSKFYPQESVREGWVEKMLSEATAKGRFEHEGWRVRKDGSRFWADVIVTAMRGTDGGLLGFVKVTRDLTERKRAEQVQEERDRFFELSRDMICVAGFDGYFKSINPAWERTLGFSREELLASPFIAFVHSEDHAATQAEAQKLSGGEETINFENRYRCKDGSYRWFAWSARAAIPQKLIYAAARDITEQKLAREKIIQLNADLRRHAVQLEAANKELEAFSYSVSHDLRAPLRHIDGFVKLFDKQENGNLDDRGRRYLGIIADSARRMGALIDDLLIFSRMGRSELRRSRLETNSLISEVVDSLQTEIQGRRIVWKIDTLPQVEADAAMLRQVWANLIGNAVKYSRPRDPAEIEIGYKAENGEFVFFVRDNGVGFDMQYAHKLFGVFQRLHRAEEFEGTGIGLANVQRIIHRHSGRVWAEGKLDEGATFYFSLPQIKIITATKE